VRLKLNNFSTNIPDNIKYYVKGPDDAIKIMGNDPKAIFFTKRGNEIGLEGYPCLVKRAKTSYLKSPISFAFQKNSPYTKLFSDFLLKMRESGEIHAIFRKHLNTIKHLKSRNDLCSRKSNECMPGEIDCVPSIGIETICSAGVVVIVGIALGVGIETVQFLSNRKYNIIRKENMMINTERKCGRMTNLSVIIICIVFIVCSSLILIVLLVYAMLVVKHEHGNLNLK